MMKIFLSPITENIILITGIINIVAILIVLFTCRFIPSLNLTKPLMNKTWYKMLYKYHSQVWWLLAPVVVLHAVIAILHILAGG